MTDENGSGYEDISRKRPPDEDEVLSGTVLIPTGDGFFEKVMTPNVEADTDTAQIQTEPDARRLMQNRMIAGAGVVAVLALLGGAGKISWGIWNSEPTSETATSAAPSMLPAPPTPEPSIVPLPTTIISEQPIEEGIGIGDLIDDLLEEPSPTPSGESETAPSVEPSLTPSPTAASTTKPQPSPTSSRKPMVSPTPKPSPKPSPTPTSTPTPTFSFSPTPIPTPTPTGSVEPTPTFEPTPTPEPSPSEPAPSPTELPDPSVSPTITIVTEGGSWLGDLRREWNSGKNDKRKDFVEVRDEVIERLRQAGFAVGTDDASSEQAFMTLVIGESSLGTQVGYEANFDGSNVVNECIAKEYAQEVGKRVLGKWGLVTPKRGGGQGVAVHVDAGAFSKNNSLAQKLSDGIEHAYQNSSAIIAQCT